MISKRFSWIVAAVVALFVISARAQDVAVTGSLSYTAAVNGTFDYTLTLKNTGTEAVEGLWLGWALSSNPVFNVANPAVAGNNLGWASPVDGNSIQYGGSPSETLLASGSSATFTFQSTSTPAQFMSGAAGQSVAYGVDASQFAIEDDSLHSVEFAPVVASVPPTPTALASAQFTDVSLGGGEYEYTITLEDTGTTTIGTFWNAWVPGEDFMAVSPTNIVSPAGWTDVVTGGGSHDGFAIQWKTSTARMSPGESLEFSFESSVPPSKMEKDSIFYPGTPVETSFVYTGAPFSDPGFEFVVASPKTLKYTLLITATDTGDSVPQGIGYATMVVNANGRVAMAGKLADGESFNISGKTSAGADATQFVIDKSLSYPSVATRGAKGSLAGILTFVKVTGTSDLSGTLEWIKPAQSKGAEPGAIDTNMEVAGSVYTPPAARGSVLPGFTNGTLVLSDTGTLSLSGTTFLDKEVTLTSRNALTVTNLGADKTKVAITASTGVFKGTFLYPGQKKPTDFDGVLFQDQTSGGGFFIGPNGSGTVTLSP